MNLENALELSMSEIEALSREEYASLVDVLTSVDKRRIDVELENLPRVYSYFSWLCSIAKETSSIAEKDLELLVYTLKKDATEEIESQGKRATKERVETEALQTEEYYRASRDVLKKEKIYSSLKGLLQALMIKRDCLVQLSANMRGEIQMHH